MSVRGRREQYPRTYWDFTTFDIGHGGVPEWLKGTDCKSVGYAYVGSNPTPSTSLRRVQGHGRAGQPGTKWAGTKRAGPKRQGCHGEVRRTKTGGEEQESRTSRGCSSMVEQQPSKLMTRVRFPSPAPTVFRAAPGRESRQGADAKSISRPGAGEDKTVKRAPRRFIEGRRSIN